MAMTTKGQTQHQDVVGQLKGVCYSRVFVDKHIHKITKVVCIDGNHSHKIPNASRTYILS
jgi:excinuclease UvrABC ATPase subunit